MWPLAIRAILLAFLLLFPLVRRFRRRGATKRAQNWMLVQGHIETHDVQAHTGLGRTAPFDVAVGYSYQYQKEFYSGSYWLGEARSMEDGDTMCQLFPLGMQVTVRVNSDRPEESMLDMSGGSVAQAATQSE